MFSTDTIMELWKSLPQGLWKTKLHLSDERLDKVTEHKAATKHSDQGHSFDSGSF